MEEPLRTNTQRAWYLWHDRSAPLWQSLLFGLLVGVVLLGVYALLVKVAY